MNNHQVHQSLAGKYAAYGQVVKKLGTTGMFIQIGIIGAANGWKHIEISHYKIAAPILFSLSIYFFIKDFLTLRRIEENMVEMILDGIELEKRYPTLDKFFHGLLESFNFVNILAQRSLINVLAIGCLGYLIFQFVSDIMFPGVAISRWFLSLFIWLPSVVLCKLSYDSLKVLDEAKEKVFAR